MSFKPLTISPVNCFASLVIATAVLVGTGVSRVPQSTALQISGDATAQQASRTLPCRRPKAQVLPRRARGVAAWCSQRTP